MHVWMNEWMEIYHCLMRMFTRLVIQNSTSTNCDKSSRKPALRRRAWWPQILKFNQIRSFKEIWILFDWVADILIYQQKWTTHNLDLFEKFTMLRACLMAATMNVSVLMKQIVCLKKKLGVVLHSGSITFGLWKDFHNPFICRAKYTGVILTRNQNLCGLDEQAGNKNETRRDYDNPERERERGREREREREREGEKYKHK